MADYSANPFNWLQGLSEIQQQAWKTWSGMTQDQLSQSWGMGNPMWPQAAPRPAENPFAPDAAMRFWREGMNRWWSVFSPPPQETPQQALFRSLFSAGENFLKMGQQVFHAFQDVQNRTSQGEDWTQSLNRIMEQAKSFIGQSTQMMTGEHAQQAMGMMWLPMEAWQRYMAAAPSMMPEMSQFFPGQGMPNYLGDMTHARLNQLLDTPGLGYARESQAQLQELAKHQLEYQQALQEFSGFVGKVGVRAVSLLHQKLLEMGASEKPIGSLKQLFDVWVDCGERAHAEISSTEEYAVANARLVNASNQVKNLNQKLLDKALAAMNLPNRSEMNTVHKQVLDLKRRVRTLEEALHNARGQAPSAEEVEAIKDDIEQMDVESLREELQSLRKAVDAAPAAAATAPKRVSKAKKET